MLQYRNRVKFAESEYPLDIEYIFTWKTGPLDTTNQAFMIKMIEDGLVEAGVLKDDDYRYVRRTTSTSIVDRSAPENFITIRIKKSQVLSDS